MERDTMKNEDPTQAQMVEFLRSQYGAEIDEFDIAEATYWFADSWHSGQSSNLYSALSTSQYKPGWLASEPVPGSMAEMAYDDLMAEFTKYGKENI